MTLFVPVVLKLCFCHSPGDRYVVVDCGGGTVDLTVHQIRLPEGHLKELYKASGTGHDFGDSHLDLIDFFFYTQVWSIDCAVIYNVTFSFLFKILPK